MWAFRSGELKINVIYNLKEAPVWPSGQHSGLWDQILLDARFFQDLPGTHSRYTYTMYMFLTTSQIKLKSCQNVCNWTAKSSHHPSILNKNQNYWFRVWYRKKWLWLTCTPFQCVLKTLGLIKTYLNFTSSRKLSNKPDIRLGRLKWRTELRMSGSLIGSLRQMKSIEILSTFFPE